MTLAEAGERLAGFLAECRAHGMRHVLIIHGKGSRSPGGRPILKPQTLHWLRQNPAVLALEPAQPSDGGDGAVYALLKRG
jgi:DNA-nicking Smr family endonuclease